MRERLLRAVADLDGTIRDTRRTIYALQTPVDELQPGLRRRVLATIVQAAAPGRLSPHVQLHGPLDVLVPPDLTEQVLAVVWAAVTNVVQHAGATSTTVTIDATDRLRVEVTDNGKGLPDEVHFRGLASPAYAATRLGGTLTLDNGENGGARLVWTVPLR